MLTKFFARVAVVGHRGIVDLEDAEGLRIVHPHGMGVGGKEQTIVLHGAPRSQELVLQQGQDHAESDKILGHIPQLRRNLPGRDQVVAKQPNGKDRSPRHQAQDRGQDAGRGTAEVEPVERGEGKENLKQKRRECRDPAGWWAMETTVQIPPAEKARVMTAQTRLRPRHNLHAKTHAGRQWPASRRYTAATGARPRRSR